MNKNGHGCHVDKARMIIEVLLVSRFNLLSLWGVAP